MPKRIRLKGELSAKELKRRSWMTQEPRERMWWRILWLLAQGKTAVEVAKATGYTHRWVGQVAKRYNARGPEGMANRRRAHSGRPPNLLSAQQQVALRRLLAGPSPAAPARWTAPMVADWMAATLGRPVNKQTAWLYLRRFNDNTRGHHPR